MQRRKRNHGFRNIALIVLAIGLITASMLAVPGAGAKNAVSDGQDRDGARADVADARLVNVRPLTEEGGFSSARWSPDGSLRLAFVRADGGGLYLQTLGDREPRKVSDTVPGFKFVWSNPDHFVYRSVEDHGMSIVSLDAATGSIDIVAVGDDLGLPQPLRQGVVGFREGDRVEQVDVGARTGRRDAATADLLAYQRDDEIYVRRGSYVMRITTEPGKYFLPQLSPDGEKVLYQEVSRGIFIANLRTGTTTSIGPGDDPVWSPDSTRVLFEKTTDDGHEILTSELVLANLAGKRMQLTNTPDRVELRPAWSPSGKSIAYDAGGAIYIADLVREQ